MVEQRLKRRIMKSLAAITLSLTAALVSFTANAGGGGGCGIPTNLDHHVVKCTGVYVSGSFFGRDKDFSKTFDFTQGAHPALDFDDASNTEHVERLNSSILKTGINIVFGCDDVDNNKQVTSHHLYLEIALFSLPHTFHKMFGHQDLRLTGIFPTLTLWLFQRHAPKASYPTLAQYKEDLPKGYLNGLHPE